MPYLQVYLPGPASATGVISSRGATNFNAPEWRGFDVRGALQHRLGLPVVYTNDANAAALYAHRVHFGADAPSRSSGELRVALTSSITYRLTSGET